MIVFENDRENGFDLGFFGLGYEPRAVHIFKKYSSLCEKKFVFGYDYNTNVFDYQKNKDFFLQSADEVIEPNDEKLPAEILRFISYFGDVPLNVCVDITVMSRHRVACVLWSLLENLAPNSTITVKYCLSEFVEPPRIAPPVKNIGPIIKQLNGTPSNIGLPPSLVVSLGYEEGKALGAANYIDASDIICLIPRSEIREFEENVRKVNEIFLKGIPSSKILDLDIHRPMSTYYDLKSIIQSISNHSRPIFLPLGPKIISALGVILGWEIRPSLPVWRVSSKEHEIPMRRKPSRHSICFTVRKTSQVAYDKI
ncbi:hypothetical protein [Marinobacter sp.]|mgnify:CR=1 FL=1|uniref:hypothetical protein n=1 Tax=Marinobacter sp. TaxID=50741 RepID=UPI000C5C2F13|nr:hypothetical protein [Marinobacter sp.]MAO12626.1 hypothetical protein [Marinobacter sp.]|tara:strand:+ start:549 stop:1481 length:933 start_codon:yes stop_codon:yes gene_type:complete